jgi:hypothetical protein
MKNTNKMSDTDKQWREVFGEAEMTPSKGVWDKIDSALSKQEAGYFKKRAFIFKLLAAASIIFALGVSLFSINYMLDHDVTQPIAVEDQSSNLESADTEQLAVVIDSEADERSISAEKSESIIQDQNIESTAQNDAKATILQNVIPLINEDNITTENEDIFDKDQLENDRHNFPFEALAAKGVGTGFTDADIYEIDHIYMIPIMPTGASRMKIRSENTGFLAGLDFSTGVFDPNFQQGGGVFASASGATFADARVESVNDQLTSFNATNKDFLLVRSAGQETKPEIQYSYGANLGFRVSKRIILQSGIAYRKASTTTTTTGYFEDPVSNTQIPIVASYQYRLDGLSAVKRTAETDLNNQYEFASIPLRAGYVFLDRKINLTLMAGISSELFLNNRIGSNNSDFETLTTTSGDGSPYKRIYFNGSLGTMLGYTFARNYLISVEPSYRFAMNSFTREDFYLNSFPSSFMVSFGVAYNFR